MTDLIVALCSSGAAVGFVLLLILCRNAHRVPRPFDGRGWR